MPVKELQTLSKKKLYLIITNYPNNGSDSIFVAPEIPELMKWFDITVFCTSGKRDCTYVRKGIKYLYFEMKFSLYKKVKYIFKYLFSKICHEEIKDIIYSQKQDKKANFLGRVRKSIEFYGCSEEFYRFFKKNVKLNEEEALYYTFWNDYYSLSLITHREKYPKFHLVSRFQGYDLYNERYLYGRQPFKKRINRELEKLYFVAKRPMEYYFKCYPELNRRKAELCCLGVYSLGNNKDKKRSSVANIVSCSNVIGLKRIDLIIEALALLKGEARWIHFGDGEEMDSIKLLAEKKLYGKENIRYEFCGNASNQLIRTFYEENEIRCFITTSSTEGGSPVSVMEAMAAKIPIIGTEVGDIPDMIDGNGILLGNNPNPDKIAQAIEWIISCPENEWRRMSNKSYRLWKEKYNAEANVMRFVDSMVKIFD